MQLLLRLTWTSPISLIVSGQVWTGDISAWDQSSYSPSRNKIFPESEPMLCPAAMPFMIGNCSASAESIIVGAPTDTASHAGEL